MQNNSGSTERHSTAWGNMRQVWRSIETYIPSVERILGVRATTPKDRDQRRLLIGALAVNLIEPPDLNSREEPADYREIKLVQNTMKKYIRQDTDPAFWARIDGLLDNQSLSYVTIQERTLDQVEYRLALAGVRTNASGPDTLVVSAFYLRFLSDGSQYVQGFAYRDGVVGVRLDGSDKEKMTREEMIRVGSDTFIFESGQPSDSDWRDILVSKGSFNPAAPGVKTSTAVDRMNVTYQIDDWGSFEVRASPIANI